MNGVVKWPCCTLNRLMLPRKCNPSSFHESGGEKKKRDCKHDSALSQSRKLKCCNNYQHDKRFYDSSLLENSGSLRLHANVASG